MNSFAYNVPKSLSSMLLKIRNFRAFRLTGIVNYAKHCIFWEKEGAFSNTWQLCSFFQSLSRAVRVFLWSPRTHGRSAWPEAQRIEGSWIPGRGLDPKGCTAARAD